MRRREELEAGTLKKDSTYTAALRLRLDTTQLPKPFQINALGSREWNIGSDWYRWTRDAMMRPTLHGQPLAKTGLKYLLIMCVGFGAVALFLLATASANTALFAEHYSLLLLLNGGIALCSRRWSSTSCSLCGDDSGPACSAPSLRCGWCGCSR